MNKSNQLTDRQEYRTPAVKIINVHSEGVICDSWGEEGEAGADGNLNECGDY